jgi:acetoin utilization deacetylase AcuC-like enzyme
VCNAGGTHHAFACHGEGFCVFNDIAIAAKYAMEVHGLSRVLVVDLDVHQGNGTADIFQADPRVTTFDMFCDRNYPWETRRRNTHDIALPASTSDEEYLSLLRDSLEMLHMYEPQFIIFQAGVDALAEDSMGKMSLSRHALAARNNMIYSFALSHHAPLLITLGGGYARPDMSPSVLAHADVFRAAAFRLSAMDAPRRQQVH